MRENLPESDFARVWGKSESGRSGCATSPTKNAAPPEGERGVRQALRKASELLLRSGGVGLLREDVGLLTGDAAERDDVGLRVAAQAVAAVDAAGDFARGEEARDDFTLGVVDLGLRVPPTTTKSS